MRYTALTASPDAQLAARWNSFLATAPLATHYVTPNYFIDPYVQGERFAVLAVDEDDRISAVATGVRSGKNVVSGMFSRPQSVFGNSADREQAAAGLLNGLNAIGGPGSLVELYTWEPMPEFAGLGMSARVSGDTTSIVMLDLAAGPDALFAGFSQTRRNELRKAEKQAIVEVKEIETDDELDEIYKIHFDWNGRKGNTPASVEQMKTAVGQRENRRVFIAKVDGKTIAGSFYRFCPGGVVEYAANFSLPEFQRLRPNDLIGWHAIRWACEAGFSHFSMGGAHLFLRRFGGDVITTYRYRRDRSRFRKHDLRENARELGAQAFNRLPQNLKDGVRRILAR
ncbi:MAG: GNAT family N-acetyltransferase [Pyrinomonadaceae bacterium]